MQKRKRISQETIDKLKGYLNNYIEERSSMNRSKKFKCFNSSAHKRGDADPSASIVPGSNNTYWKCFSCGAKGSIFEAVKHREGINSFYDQVVFLSRKYGVELEYEGEVSMQTADASNTATIHKYYYQDENNRTVYKIVRKEYFEDGIRKKDFSMFSKTDSGWVPGLRDVKRYLYKLPQVLKAIENNDIIFLVEGEKCADQVLALGFVGTTTPGGAKSWKPYSGEYVPYLKGARVVVIPDNDESGRQYAEDVIESLTGTAGSVRKLELPGLSEKGDIVDWVQAGGTKEKLLELISSVERQGPIFEKNFCYCKTVKDTDVKISNFIINIKHMIVGVNESLIEAELITEDGARVERILKTDDFIDAVTFRKAIGSFQLSYSGKAEELQHIKVLVSKKYYTAKTGVGYTGFHKVNGCWHFVSEHGSIAENLKRTEDVVLLEDSAELGSDILKAEAINKEELLTVAPHLFTFNTLNITSTILGYVSSLFLKGKLKEVNIKHNHLIIEGQSGSGKSSTVESVIVPLLSIRGSALNASECGAFALNRAASSSNFIPVIIDEYKPYTMGKHRVNLISNVMRNSYDNHVVMKGVASLGKNREFSARASIILCGEVGMEETANIERSLKVVFSTANQNDERRKSIGFLKQNPGLLSKLGRSLLNGGLKMNEKKLRELYYSIYNTLSEGELVNERVRNSVTNCLLGIALLKAVFDELNLDFQESTGINMEQISESIKKAVVTDLLDYGNSSKGIIEDSLETMNRMAVNSLLQREYDYDAVVDGDGDFVLRLNYTAFYDKFARYCREHSVNHEVLPLSSFKRQLAKLSYCKSYNKPTSFKDREGGPGKNKTFRAAVINVDALKKKNVDVDYLVDSEC